MRMERENKKMGSGEDEGDKIWWFGRVPQAKTRGGKGRKLAAGKKLFGQMDLPTSLKPPPRTRPHFVATS